MPLSCNFTRRMFIITKIHIICVLVAGANHSAAQRIGRGQTTTSNVKLSANRSIAAQRIIVFIEKWSGIRISHQLRTFAGTLQTLQLRSVGAVVLGKAIYNTIFYDRSAKTHIWRAHSTLLARSPQCFTSISHPFWWSAMVRCFYLTRTMYDFLLFDFYLHLRENQTEKKISLQISSVWAHDTSFVIRSFVCVQKLPAAFCQPFVSMYRCALLHHSWLRPCGGRRTRLWN